MCMKDREWMRDTGQLGTRTERQTKLVERDEWSEKQDKEAKKKVIKEAWQYDNMFT